MRTIHLDDLRALAESVGLKGPAQPVSNSIPGYRVVVANELGDGSVFEMIKCEYKVLYTLYTKHEVR